MGGAEEVRNSIHRTGTTDKNITIAKQLPAKGCDFHLWIKGAIAGGAKFAVAHETFSECTFAPRDKIHLSEETLCNLGKSSNVGLKGSRFRWQRAGGMGGRLEITVQNYLNVGGRGTIGHNGDWNSSTPVVGVRKGVHSGRRGWSRV